jgi:hypothetical protein
VQPVQTNISRPAVENRAGLEVDIEIQGKHTVGESNQSLRAAAPIAHRLFGGYKLGYLN